MKMVHVTINTSKLEESIKFYEEIVGLKIVRDLRGHGPAKIVFLAEEAGDTCIELIDSSEAYKGTGLSIGFHVDDVAAHRDALVDKGMDVSPIISPNPATKFFFTFDPNGVKIQFI